MLIGNWVDACGSSDLRLESSVENLDAYKASLLDKSDYNQFSQIPSSLLIEVAITVIRVSLLSCLPTSSTVLLFSYLWHPILVHFTCCTPSVHSGVS